MKIKELIELLKKQDPEAEVEMEGCDCNQVPDAVEIQEDGKVLICRVYH